MKLYVSTSITGQIASIHLKIDIHSILLLKGVRNDFGCEELMLIIIVVLIIQGSRFGI